MKRLFASIALVTLTASLYGQNMPAPSKKELPRPQKIVAILNEARLAAPELAADTFLRVVESKKAADPAWRREILDEALRLADTAKYPVRRNIIPLNGMSVDTHAGYLAYAHALKLNRLSLTSRVVRAALADDKARARQILFQIGGDLELTPLSCEDSLAYDVTEIYSTVGAVAKAAFTPKEVEEGIRGLFVAPWLENIASPAQIAPAIDLLSAMNGPAQEKQMLFAALSKAINKGFGDDRSFTHAVERDQVARRVFRLASGDQDAHLKADLVNSVRAMVIKNMSSARCKENELKKDSPLPSVVAGINTILADKPISITDIETSEVKGRVEIKPYFQSSTGVKLMKEYREIAAHKGSDKMPIEEWQTKVIQFADNLAAWTPTDKETESEVFNQKSVMYRTLIGSVDGQMKSQILRTYLRFLSSSPMQKESFIEWFYYLQDISDRETAAFKRVASEVPNQQFSLIVQRKDLGI